MPPEIVPSDEEYASAEDSDFAPDVAPAAASDASSDEESDAGETTVKESKKTKAKPAKRKRVGNEEAEDLGFENSGDEAIIEKGLKRQRRKKGKDNVEEDEGGEGGLVKTRSMRAQEKVEKKPLADTTAATVDVDALWESMISGKPTPKTIEQSSGDNSQIPGSGTLSSPDPKGQGQNRSKDSRSPSTTLSEGAGSMIMIKQTYNFAGKVHSVEKLVPRNSAEAKLFLASQTETAKPTETPEATIENPLFTKPKRPLKKARRSAFEPLTEIPIRTDLHFGVRKESGVVILEAGQDAKRLNTVQKSAMDWAGFVDKEGIADELDAAGKAKGAYKARQEFLARVEQKKEEDSRRARGLPV